MVERKKYTAEFKQRAVDLVLSSDRPVAQVCVEIGVNEGTLGNWVRKYRQKHPEEFAGDQPETAAYGEHQRVLKENTKLKQEVLDSNRERNTPSQHMLEVGYGKDRTSWTTGDRAPPGLGAMETGTFVY